MPHSDIPDHYYDEVVDNYEAERSRDPLWAQEQSVVESFVGSIPPGSRILDAPVGTGRFLPYYAAAACQVTALDVSTDMLAKSAQMAEELGMVLSGVRSDIRYTEFDDNSFDATVSFRLLTWFNEYQFEAAVAELARVTSRSMFVSLHTRSHPSIARNPLAILPYARMLVSQGRKRWRADAHIHLHRRAFVEEVFRRHGLRVVAVHILKRGRVSTYAAWELRFADSVLDS